MELRQLGYFVAVCDELSFSRAAEHHFISQSAISHQVARLERDVGVQLLDRSTRRVTITDAGARLLPVARQMLQLQDVAYAAVRPADSRIRLAANMSFAHRSLTAISELRDAHPEVEVEFVIRAFTERVDAVISGDVDVALIRGTVDRPEVDVRPLWVQQLVVATAVRHPLATSDTVSLRALADHPLLLPPATDQVLLRNVVRDAFAHLGISPTWGPPIPPDHTAAAELVNAPDSWTVLYDDTPPPGVVVRSDAEGLLRVPVCAVTRHGREPSELLDNLLDRLVDTVTLDW